MLHVVPAIWINNPTLHSEFSLVNKVMIGSNISFAALVTLPSSLIIFVHELSLAILPAYKSIQVSLYFKRSLMSILKPNILRESELLCQMTFLDFQWTQFTVPPLKYSNKKKSCQYGMMIFSDMSEFVTYVLIFMLLVLGKVARRIFLTMPHEGNHFQRICH